MGGQGPSASSTWAPKQGAHSLEAQQLQREVLQHLREHGETDMGALRAVNHMGRRFNRTFFDKSRANDGSWKKWLSSLPGVEVIIDPTRAAYHSNQPTIVRL